MRISDWSSDVCSSDLLVRDGVARRDLGARQRLAIGHLGNREQRPERIAGLVGDHRTKPSENMGKLAEFGIAVTSRTPGSPATRRSGSTPAAAAPALENRGIDTRPPPSPPHY